MVDKSEMIFGVRAVIEAIQAGKEIDKILVKKDIQSDLSKELVAALLFHQLRIRRQKTWYLFFSKKARTRCSSCWMV